MGVCKPSATIKLVIFTLFYLNLHFNQAADPGRDDEIHDRFLNGSERIVSYLFDENKYFKRTSPVSTLRASVNTSGNHSVVSPFLVEIMITYARLQFLEEKEQIAGMSVEYQIKWIDRRLRWDPNQFSGIERIFVHRDLLWFPENNIEAKYIEEILPEYQQTAQLSSDGTVSLIKYVNAQVVCPVALHRFPFDEQQCSVRFLVFSYLHKDVAMKGKVLPEMNFTLYTGNGDFTVTNVDFQHYVIGIEENAKREILRFTFYIRRHPEFYICVIVIPCYLLTVLSVIGLFWTVNVQEEQISKLSIGLTSLMSMTVLLNMVSDMVPRVTQFPLLGIYVLICIAISAVSCVILVIMKAQKQSKLDSKKALLSATPRRSMLRRIGDFVTSPNVILLIFFQVAALVNFVVFMSYRRYEEKPKPYPVPN